MKKGSKMTIESRKKMSESRRGKPSGVLGMHWKLSDETRKNISNAMIGKKHALGAKRSDDFKRKVSERMLGNKYCIGTKNHLGFIHSEETRQKMSLANKGKMKGENHPRWVSDRSKLKKSGDSEKDRRSSAYITWRRDVCLRDSFKCKIANPDCAGRIEAHHILGYEKYPELRYQTNNGITLCHFHHPRKRVDEIKLSHYFQNLVSSNRK